ncbi:hypothetical protein M0Q50_06785 [bacterium]|jgi:hypothetical protein|nr:hypothetical protein [bacterium]
MANRYFRALSSPYNTSNSTNWSTTTGGSGGASVPVFGDVVYFDGNSGGNAIVDAQLNVLKVDFTGFINNIAFNADISNFGADSNYSDTFFTLNLTMTYSYTSSYGFKIYIFAEYDGSSATVTLVSNGATLTAPITFINSGNDTSFFVLSDNANFLSITQTGYQVYRAGTGTLTINGSVTVDTKLGMGFVTFTGTGTISGGTYSGFNINSSGTLTIGNIILRGGVYTYTAGTVNCTGIVLINANVTLDLDGISLNNINIYNTITLNSDLNVSGYISIEASATFAGNYGFTAHTLKKLTASTGTLNLKSGNIYSVTNIISIVSNSTAVTTLRSSIASSAAILNVTAGSTYRIDNMIINDIDVSGGMILKSIGTTLARTTNISNYNSTQEIINSVPTGGGGTIITAYIC